MASVMGRGETASINENCPDESELAVRRPYVCFFPRTFWQTDRAREKTLAWLCIPPLFLLLVTSFLVVKCKFSLREKRGESRNKEDMSGHRNLRGQFMSGDCYSMGATDYNVDAHCSKQQIFKFIILAPPISFFVYSIRVHVI